jgi:hypothetical protein
MSVNKQIRDLINDYCSQETSIFGLPYKTTTISNGANNNNLFKSSQTKINKSYFVYTSPNKLNRNKNIKLLIPTNSLSNLENLKLKREIKTINKDLGIITQKQINLNNPKDLLSYALNKDENKVGKYRNRPVLNLSTKEFNFSPKYTIGNNKINRSVIEAGVFKISEKVRDSNGFENGGRKKYFSLFDNNKNYSSGKNIFKRSERENNEFNKFMIEMNKFKQKKIKEWRKGFLEDNSKY